MALTNPEVDQLVSLLDKMEYPYPQRLFEALCRNTIVNPVEIILLTEVVGEVLLFRKPPSDPFFGR